MKFPTAVPLLSLCLLLMLGIGGCTLLLGKSYYGFHDERQERIITDTTAKLEGNPYDAELYVARGTAYSCMARGKTFISNLEKALSDFNRAIEIDAENAAAYRGRASASSAIDFSTPPFDVVHDLHRYEADIKKADILNPGKLNEEINEGFGYISSDTNEFIYPVAGDCVAENHLILGSTTKTQVAEMLPPLSYYPGIGSAFIRVRNPTKPRIGKVGEVVDNARYMFTPDEPSSMQLVFDMNNKLVVIRKVYSGVLIWDERSMQYYQHERSGQIARKRFEKYQDVMGQYQFAEVYRGTEDILHGYKVMRAKIAPCVTVDIEVPIEPDPGLYTYVSEYIYTCPTK